jgi:hypothetical protein
MSDLEHDDLEQDPEDDLRALPIEAVPGLARIAVGAWVRGASWGLGGTVRAGRRLSRAALSGESAAELLEEVRDDVVEGVRQVLGIVEGDARAQPVSDAFDAIVGEKRSPREARVRSLRERGAALLERAAEVDGGIEIHPGFDRIVDQLAPDEARILKLLVNEGPQPIVYVNRAAPLGIGTREVARRLSLIGREAGCLHPEHVPAYLDNLVRLGLVAIRRDPIPSEEAYQVVEAQPEVIEAMKSVRGPVFRGHSSRRSVHITDFGRTFCQVCFPAEHLTGEIDAIDPDGIGELPPQPDLDDAFDG